jgi:hypothetical protein
MCRQSWSLPDLQAVPTNVRPKGTNTLAYYAAELITAAISFMM